MSFNRKYKEPNEYERLQKAPKSVDDIYKFRYDEPAPKIISLQEALNSGMPVYSKVINITTSYNSIKHISQALVTGDALYLDPYYIKFTKDVYIFNVLHNKITLFKQNTTLKIN